MKSSGTLLKDALIFNAKPDKPVVTNVFFFHPAITVDASKSSPRNVKCQFFRHSLQAAGVCSSGRRSVWSLDFSRLLFVIRVNVLHP